MHAKVVVPKHLMLFQTLGLQKLPESVDQLRFLLSTLLALARKLFTEKFQNHSNSVLP